MDECHECRRESSGQSAQPGPDAQGDTEAVPDVDSGDRQAYREGAELRQWQKEPCKP